MNGLLNHQLRPGQVRTKLPPQTSFLLLVMCFFLCAPLGSAQVEDEEGDGIDLGFTEPQDNGLDFSYPAFPWIERQAVVLYENQAQAYICLNGGNPSGHTTLYYTVSGATTTPIPVVVANEGHVLANLPLNKAISVFVNNAQAEMVKIGELSTYRHEEDVIQLPAHIYRPISGWLHSPEGGSNLYTFVAGLSEAHQVEKAHFVQQFFYDGHPLPDALVGQVPPPPTVSTESSCICRPLQLMVTQEATPIDAAIQFDAQNGNYMPLYKTGGETTEYFGSGDRGKRWHAYSYEGAAKYQQVWIETRKCVGGDNKMEMNNLSPAGPGTAAGPQGGNRSWLSYTLACIGIEDFRPEDCPCERPRRARVCWRYAAEAEVSVDLRPGGCWNGRGIWGGASDVAVLMSGYADQDPSSMPMPLSAGIVTAGAGCYKNFDESKLAVNLFKTALYGYKTIKGLGAQTFDEHAWGLVYGNLAAQAIKDLFSDDYINASGSCGTVVTPAGVLLDGCDFFDLQPNRTRVVALVSNSSLIVEGHGKYQGKARILSSYALSGTISKSDPDQTGENCCSNGHGVYSLSSFYPGMSAPVSQLWVRSNFIAAGLNWIPGLDLNITGEWGYRGGGERPDCKLAIVDGRGEGSGGQGRPSRLNMIGNTAWLLGQPEGEDWHFRVIDAAGRTLHAKRGTGGGDSPLYDFGAAHAPPGLYFVHLRTKGGAEGLRVAKLR